MARLAIIKRTGGKAMAVRLVVTFHAAPGKGAGLAQAMKARYEVSRQDAGCEQFEVFQSVLDPDKLVLLELWGPSGAGHPRQAADAAPAFAGGAPTRRRRRRRVRVGPGRSSAASELATRPA
jgi:quinol monooxygenase YgiN